MRRIPQIAFEEPTDRHQHDGIPIVVHSRPAKESTESLVLFVHGLTGHRYGYWNLVPRLVFEDFPSCDVGLYHYKTAWQRFGVLRRFRSISLPREAELMADSLSELPHRVIILVCHSLGGVLARATISRMLKLDRTKDLQRLAGLVLVACPQLGSRRVPWPLTLVSGDARALYPHNAHLEECAELFDLKLDLHLGGSSSRKKALPTWAMIAAHDRWVDSMSAGTGIPDAQKRRFGASHGSIIEPRDRDAESYCYLRECLQRSLNAAKKTLIASEDLEFDAARPRDVPALRRMAVDLFGPDITPEATVAGFAARPDVLRVARRLEGQPGDWHETLEGYFCVLPLTAAAAEAVRKGELTGDRIDDSHLTAPGSAPAAVYIGAIAGLNFRTKALLTLALRNHLDTLRGGSRLEILARPVTSDGERAAADKHMAPKYQIEGAKPIWSTMIG